MIVDAKCNYLCHDPHLSEMQVWLSTNWNETVSWKAKIGGHLVVNRMDWNCVLVGQDWTSTRCQPIGVELCQDWTTSGWTRTCNVKYPWCTWRFLAYIVDVSWWKYQTWWSKEKNRVCTDWHLYLIPSHASNLSLIGVEIVMACQPISWLIRQPDIFIGRQPTAGPYGQPGSQQQRPTASQSR